MNTIIKTSLLILFMIFSQNIISQNFKIATDYLTFVEEEMEVIALNSWKLTKAIAHSKSDRTVSSKRKVLLKSVERAIAKINRASGFEGDEYKNQVLEHLSLRESLLKNDFAKIIDMKEVAEQSYDLMEAYIIAREMADDKMTQAQAEYEVNFYQFAKKHNINIIESDSDLSKKMKISGEVFDHYNDLYLIFFKVYINEVYLMDALSKNDINGIQQNTNALNSTAKDGLELIKNIDLYKDDTSIINATQSIFEFYIDESENKIPNQLDFLVLNEDMTRITETLEKTPEKKRTKKQIDSYNAKIKELNNAIKSYNKINVELNKNRQTALNALNTANEQFLAKHIPND